MYRLARITISIFLLAMAVSVGVRAGDFSLPDNNLLLPDLTQLKSTEWLRLDSQNSYSKYENSDSYNQQMLHGVVMDYLESKLSSLGIPHSAMTLTGAALIFAIGQDAKLNLNESKTMSLQFQDMKNADRAFLYRLKYSW